MTEKEITRHLESKEGLPSLIIDFVRHGETEYGGALGDKVSEMGQDPKTFGQMPKIHEEISDPIVALEGRITEKGKEGLRESVRNNLLPVINLENDIVAVVSGPRTRHIESAEIIADELVSNGVSVVSTREHGALIDFKQHWTEFVGYIKKYYPEVEVDFVKFWDDMRNQEEADRLVENGHEGLREVEHRMKYFLNLLKRFSRRFVEKTGKVLRVVAVTSDVNLAEFLQKDLSVEDKKQIWIKNAEILEIKSYADGREEISRMGHI